MLIRLILFISLSVFMEGAYAQSLCSQVFEVPYHRGLHVSGHSRQVVHYLGAGHMGGKVFRVLNPSTGRTELHKKYFNGESMKNDRAALALLAEIVGADPLVKINQPLRQIEEATLVFPDVRGFALDNHPRRGLRERLEEEFGVWGLKVEDSLEGNPNFTVHRHDRNEVSMDFHVPRGQESQYEGLQTVEIFLKPDNVIVDSFTGQMVIFDPY